MSKHERAVTYLTGMAISSGGPRRRVSYLAGCNLVFSPSPTERSTLVPGAHLEENQRCGTYAFAAVRSRESAASLTRSAQGSGTRGAARGSNRC